MTLNGVVVADGTLLQAKGVVTVPVSLQSSNVITVRDVTVSGTDTTVGKKPRDIPCLTIAVERE